MDWDKLKIFHEKFLIYPNPYNYLFTSTITLPEISPFKILDDDFSKSSKDQI
jgi:hypothetical protein